MEGEKLKENSWCAPKSCKERLVRNDTRKEGIRRLLSKFRWKWVTQVAGKLESETIACSSGAFGIRPAQISITSQPWNKGGRREKGEQWPWMSFNQPIVPSNQLSPILRPLCQQTIVRWWRHISDRSPIVLTRALLGFGAIAHRGMIGWGEDTEREGRRYECEAGNSKSWLILVERWKKLIN